MKPSCSTVFDFMSSVEHFQIPNYQRSYSWTEKQCSKLFEDMLAVGQQNDNKVVKHQMGIICCQQISQKPLAYTIIDGQQRLTTFCLFYLALYHLSLQRSQPDDLDVANTLQDKILFDNSEIGRNLNKSRFELTPNDQMSLDKLFNVDDNEFDQDSLLTVNYKKFLSLMKESELSSQQLLALTKSLDLIVLEMEPGEDPQHIFESLNATGLPLSEGDKIRNFVLIGFDTDERDGYYNNLWQPMEKNCQGDLAKFIRYYLAIKVKASPRQKYLYSDFKDYVEQKSVKKVDLMQEMLEYSKLFARLRDCSYGVYSDAVNLRPQEKLELSYEIQQRLKGINLLYSVHTPFILQCMYLNQQGKLSAQDFATVLERIDTLLLRRWVCGIQSQGLDHWFMSLLPLTEQDDFLNQLDMKLHRTGKDKFIMPNDDNFGKALRERDLFNIKDSKDMLPYMIERLENGLSREWVLFNEYYSIEHIMPQTLTHTWEAELGADAAKIHKEWLHRLANLTLTAYNSVYSNRSFAEKCSLEHGLTSSALRLNREIADIGKSSHWSVPELQQRAESLIAKALKIWPYHYCKEEASQLNTASVEVVRPAEQTASTKSQATNTASQAAVDDAVFTTIHTGLQQSPFDEDIEPVSTQKGNSSEAKSQLQQDDIFDYCLADEPGDFAGTRLAGCEFLGQHYDVKKWAPLQRMLLTQIYQRNPERLRSWLAEKWGKFNLLAQLVTPEPNVTVARADVFEIDKGIYLNSHQPVYDKVKMLKQLFELMEIDPKELTLHIVKMRNKD